MSFDGGGGGMATGWGAFGFIFSLSELERGGEGNPVPGGGRVDG